MISRNFHTDIGFDAMTVDNTGFLVDRLGQDCHPLQYLRELSQNSVEAVQRSGCPGEIVWDCEDHGVDADGKPIQKLSITDNGAGMTGYELEKFINQLSSSCSEQGVHGNYGVGAKIAAATQHPHGVVYSSWKGGLGNKIHLCRDSRKGQYGLRQFDLGDDQYGYHAPLDTATKPDMIEEHGTKVVLLGKADGDNTMTAPKGTPSPSRWISKYLNSRYYKFPEGVSVRVREGWEDSNKNVLRTLSGMEAYLDDHAIASGSVKLKGARAHWRILKDEPALASNSGHIASSGHVAALHQDELYELQTGIAGVNRLQQFGIVFGHRQVVIYVEPRLDSRHLLTTDTARTRLLRDGEPLPWADWASQFRKLMPTKLRRFIEAKGASASNSDNSSSIRKRLSKVMSLFKLSRYKSSKTGTEKVEGSTTVNGGTTPDNGQGEQGDGQGTSGDASNNGTRKAHSKAKEGQPGSEVKTDPFPSSVWISTKDGTRDPDQLEDRAAQFLPEQNLLQINADFCAFVDMANHCSSAFADQPGARDLAQTTVRTWYEQTLVETVLGIQAMYHRKLWSSRDLEAALSPEALTAAVMTKYHIHGAVTRALTRQLGVPESRGV